MSSGTQVWDVKVQNEASGYSSGLKVQVMYTDRYITWLAFIATLCTSSEGHFIRYPGCMCSEILVLLMKKISSHFKNINQD